MDNGEKDSTSYSSEDEIQRPVVKRKKKAKATFASSSEEEDSDVEIKPRRHAKPLKCDSEDENNNLNGINPTSSASKNCADSSNDLSDNEQAEKCAICLSKFLGQDIATPETCDHVFCLECIQEWAKNVNTCPIDRLKFNLILIRHHKEEKIIKTIVVNNSALPYYSDPEESLGQADCCDICGEDKNEGSIFRCHECYKLYHYHCIAPTLPRAQSATWQCPACENYNWGTTYHRMTPSAFRVYRSLNSGIRTHSPTQSTLHSTSQEFLRLRRRVLYPRAVIQRLLSSSDSSEEDTSRTAVPSAAYQNPLISSVASKASCPLLRKRRNLCRARNRALVSATTAATETTYNSDSDDDYRLPAPESFDLVGSILESQSRLHCPDVLTLTRDGTLLQTPNNTGSSRSSNTASSTQNSEQSGRSFFNSSPPFSDNTVSPFTTNAVVRQRPLNPTHNNSSNYSEASMPTYSCSSSGAPKERTLSYDENTLARPPHGASNNDRFGNDPSSPVVQKSFCPSAPSEEMKKDGRAGKGQHSEDEVDIYSDIESVGEEDGLTSDSIEPPKGAYKCDNSPQLSNPNESSDSSDNDLVIDEDQHADEDHEKVKEPQDVNPVKNNQVCESEESNLSSDTTSDQDQLMIDTSAQNPSSPCIENSSDNCYNPGDVSPHGVFVNDESNHSKLNSEQENTHKEESDSDAGQPISDADMQDGEVSLDSAKKSYQGDVSTPCTSVKSSPKSCREETADGFEMQCENSISNENSHSAIDNASLFRHEESKEVFREASNHENENTFNSISREAEVENFENESCSNLSDESSQVEKSVNFQGEKTFSFAKDDSVSEPEELMENATSQVEEENANNTDLIDICNDISMKSDDEDNLDSLENASTPCMDENLDGQLENSPMHVENSEEEGQASPNNSEEEKECSATENTTEKTIPDEPEASISKKGAKNRQSGSVEDISDAGSEGISAELNDEILPSVDTTEKEFDDVERKVASLFSPDHGDDEDCIEITKDCAEFKKCPSPQTSQSFEDQEEGEIIEERPVHRCKKKKNRSQHDDTGEYGEYAPRVNISDLPRIPKLKRDKDRDSMPETISFENKRTSVLSRVDLGEDISWKRLSKHTRERSYRDGKTRDEKLLYRERESRKKSKKSNVASRRNDSKNSERRRDDKKSETEKSKDYDSRSRKSEKSKTTEYDYSDREKRKSHKDKHSSKDKHSKDKKEKDKYDKKFSKDDKYEREKLKDESRYERDLRYDKEERFERIVYEKGKYKEKEHKSKHKDRKSESSKTCKEHSREKHKHTHSSDRFSDKQREVRKIDDKIKIVVEQKENRREKSKHKERKEIKIDKKPIIQRKVEPPQRSPSYKEITSIESKEIFAKGDSIIINVNFNRATSPKMTTVPDSDSKERKVMLEEKEPDEQLTSLDVKNKSKQIMIDKNKPSSDSSMSKRPSTPPGKSSSVLSVSESYWQSGEDPDGNNSPASDKSVEIISVEPAAEVICPTETNIHDSPEMHSVQSGTKDNTSLPEKTLTPSNEASDSASKENENFSSKRRSPRSPSPPSPADNDSYDPCEPTRSPSPPPMPSPPPLPSANPKPPPSPELPPLPPEPEPTDESHRPNPPDFISGSSASVSNNSQANTVQTQTSSASPMQSMLLPPSFLSRVSAATNNFQSMSPLAQSSRNGNFQMNNHGSVLLPPNQMQQMMGGNFLSHMHGNTVLPPPPNPPNLAHMTSVPPPPPPPASMSLLSQARHPRMNVQPTLTPNSLLQSLTMVHGVNNAPMQLIHHLPPNLSGILANHQSPIVQNPPTTSLQVSNIATNQQVLRMVFSQNQMSNHGALLQSQNNCNKSQSGLVPLNSQNLLAHQKSENKHKCSPTTEKNEVIDMDVGTPYSPGDSPSVDSIGDYSPACSPEASSPKSKDVFDTLFSANQRTSEKRTYDALSSNEKPKAHSGTKKSKHEHKRHAVRMLMKDKHKKSRKDQKQADEAQLKILDELPSSAVEMQVKEKFLKKLNRQERVVEEVKMVLKPFYKSRDVTKEEYKDILRKAVPKICHNRSGEINPVKVKSLVESYVKKAKHSKKKSDKRKSKFS